MKVGNIFIFAFNLSSTLAQFVLQNGTCPNFHDCRYEVEMTNEKLLGIWYLESSIPYAFQLNHKCTYYNFTVHHEPNTIRFDKFELNESKNQKRETFGIFNYTSNGFIDMTYTDLELPLTFTSLILTPNLWVVVSCHECNFLGSAAGIYSYVFTRLEFPECSDTKEARKSIDICGVPESALVRDDKSNCLLC